MLGKASTLPWQFMCTSLCGLCVMVGAQEHLSMMCRMLKTNALTVCLSLPARSRHTPFDCGLYCASSRGDCTGARNPDTIQFDAFKWKFSSCDPALLNDSVACAVHIASLGLCCRTLNVPTGSTASIRPQAWSVDCRLCDSQSQ